jgi:hypothetical protein
MTNTPDYYTGYGGYELAAEPEGNAQRVRALWIATAVLGLITFGVSFWSPVTLGWAVWFTVLAAVVAAIGLLPRQSAHGWVAATLAVTGFLVALSTWLTADEAGWAVVVIVVLNLLQAAVALAALLLADDEQPVQSGADYAAYAQYMQAYQAYAQYQQAAPAQQQAAAQGRATAQAQSTATAQARGVAGARADAAQESYEALQQRYQQHAGRPSAPQPPGAAHAQAPAAGPDPGIPNYGRSRPSGVHQPGVRAEEPGEASSN